MFVFQLVVTAAIIFIFTIEDVKLYAQQHMVNYRAPPSIVPVPTLLVDAGLDIWIQYRSLPITISCKH